MHDSVLGYLESKLVVLLLCGQDTINEEIGGFKVIGFDGQLLDRVPSESMKSVDENRMSTFLDCPTCSGELGLFTLVATMNVECA